MIANKLKLERKIKPYFFFTLVIGSIAQLAIIFPSGLYRRGVYRFWGVQFHDALWHVSVAQKLKDFSFENPVYSGEIIRNYHYLTNLIIAFVSKITGISLFHVTFRILPVVVTIAIGISTFILVNKVFKNQKAAVWAMFFVYLGSNLAYILPFFGLGYPIWETTMWVQQPISVFSNLPFATSIPIALSAIICLKLYLDDNKRKYFLSALLLFSLLPVIKSHSVVFLLALGIVGIWRVLTKRRLDILFLSLLIFILAYIFISPTFRFEKHLIFEPGWFLRTMIEAPDRLNWQDWALRYQFYKAHYDIFNLAKFFAVAFTIFFVGNLGTRMIALFGIPNIRKLFRDEIHFFLGVSAFGFALVPMLFLTTGVAWNSIQFFYYFLLISGIYSGVGMYKLISKIKKVQFKWLFSVVIILITIPVNLRTLWFFYSHPADSKIQGVYLESLQKLSKVGKASDVILNLPAGSNAIEMAAFTGKTMFLGDWLQAIVPGHDHQGRLDLLTKAMEREGDFIELLKKYGIDWIYIKGPNPQIIEDIEYLLDDFYISDKIKIYHVE